MADEARVLDAATRRADALARGDAAALTSLLHERFRWTTHVGQTFDRDEYVRRNTQRDSNDSGDRTVWRSQRLDDVEVVVVGTTAVLHAEVTDEVAVPGGGTSTFTMPMTQVWVLEQDRWLCLAGHAGPRRT